jgi:hypothetical protein
MPRGKKDKKKKSPSMTPRQAALPAPGPRDPKTDVKIAGDWFDRWLKELDERELKTYLSIAHHTNLRSYHEPGELASLEGDAKRAQETIARLEKRGLLEVIRENGKLHYHFPHRDTDGFHRAVSVRPSIAEALAFQRRMTEELVLLTEQDETPALREKIFRKYPDLRGEYELWRTEADPDAPAWRLWMEVSRYLIREFEQRFGSLKEDHGEVFKKSAEAVIQHHLDVVDGVTREIASKIDRLFPEVTKRWAIAPSEESFVKNVLVKRLASRFGVGPEQIFVNVLEALTAQGLTIVAVDDSKCFESLLLPTTTGLTKSEERVLFLRPDERQAGKDGPRTRERVHRARNRYANHLIRCALETLLDFFRDDKVKDLDAALQIITDKVNEQLSLLEGPASQHPEVTLEHVIDRFDRMRRAGPAHVGRA